MIALIIIAVILSLITALLFLPLDINLSLKDDFYFEVLFSHIKIFKSDKKPKKKKTKAPKAQKTGNDNALPEKIASKPKKLFEFLKEKHGFMGAVKSIFGFFKDCLSSIKKLLKHIKIKKVELNLTVASSNAAKTAIQYGIACAAVYPVLAFLDSFASVEFKSINITSDFNSDAPDFNFSLTVRMRIFFLIAAALGLYKQYTLYLQKENYNERQ